MTTREQLTQERLDALIDVIVQDGVTPAGEVPADHVEAIRGVGQLGTAREVAQAHAQGNAPPDVGRGGAQ